MASLNRQENNLMASLNKQNSPPDANIKRLAQPNSSALHNEGSSHLETGGQTGLAGINGIKTPPQAKPEGELESSFTNNPHTHQKRGNELV